MFKSFSGTRAVIRHCVFGLTLLVMGVGFGAIEARSEDAPDHQKLEKGRVVFHDAAGVGCKSCHGLFGEGDVGIGPYIRGKDRTAARGAIKFADAMKFLRDELSDEDIDAVSAYYSWLGRVQLVRAAVKRGKFVPDTISIYPGTEIQLAISNQGTKPIALGGEAMGIKALVVDGKEISDVFWRAPQQPGDFALSCTNCKGQPAPTLNIQVSQSAQKFEPPAQLDLSLGGASK